MSYNILICDDEKDIVSALKIYLEAEGYRTVAAYNGKEALALLDREDIHLVLLDIMMPGMDGIETLARLRESSNVPVILLTAKSEDTDKVPGPERGRGRLCHQALQPRGAAGPGALPAAALSAAGRRHGEGGRAHHRRRPAWTTAARPSPWTGSR